jgi:hypothetical protein
VKQGGFGKLSLLLFLDPEWLENENKDDEREKPKNPFGVLFCFVRPSQIG